ncbi:hypothetical protein [Candidatus Tisiphia endosymbiont of Oplodontha viridula]|uniref:hypothetical protein n=2 Tax=unclassified Candidatus Tisiphia TaxID=2996318 RepID=UPI0035C8D9AD
MFSKYVVNIFLFIIMLILSSCSVYKAASNEGISVSDITKCQTKGCFLSHGMEIVDRHQEENGKYMETYRAMARKSGLNYLRAAGHGVLDVVTLGVWEVVLQLKGLYLITEVILQLGLLIRIKRQRSLKRSKFMMPMVRGLSKVGV